MTYHFVFVFVLMGWSLLPNALRPFKIYCAPPNWDFLTSLKSKTREPQFLSLSRRTCAQDFYVLKKSIDLSWVWTREHWISRRARYPETNEADIIFTLYLMYLPSSLWDALWLKFISYFHMIAHQMEVRLCCTPLRVIPVLCAPGKSWLIRGISACTSVCVYAMQYS